MAQPIGLELDPDEIAAAVRAERLRLCDYLDGLQDIDWTVQSLCAAWNVREVVAHLTTTTREKVPSVIKAAIKARGSFDRMTAQVARDRAATSTSAELIEQLRESAGSSRRMLGSGPMDPLMDLLIHGQDIARPLKRRHETRIEVAVPALAYVAANRLLGAPKRLAGLELVAADAQWSAGEGQQVYGTTEELLLVAAGRPAALTNLSGPGVDRLTERLRSR